jgi:tRNA1(Val) A37 N6-methylase TrmN6
MFLRTQVAKWRGIDKIDYSIDEFHRGKFVLIQPKGAGHRAGIDAMLLAGAVPQNFAGQLVDLGAGAGAGAFAVASRCAQAVVTLVENNELMLGAASQTLNHPSNARFKARSFIINCDVESKGRQRLEAGLIDNSFDFAIMNPPFNSAKDRQTPDEVKAKAHVMSAGLFELWIRTATSLVRPKGVLAMIARPDSLLEITQALQGRFGAIRIIPIHPHADKPAIRIILIATRASRGCMSIDPALILHEKDSHGLLPRADQIINGLISFI